MGKDTSLVEGERSVLIMHPHWKVLLRPALIVVLLVVAATVLISFIPPSSAASTIRLAIAAIAVIAVVIFSGGPLLHWRTTTYELTTRRLRMREGILSRDGRDVPLDRINDVSFSHGLLDRMLGCGKLTVESAGEHGQLVLTEIPQVEMVQSTLYQLIEEDERRLSAPPAAGGADDKA